MRTTKISNPSRGRQYAAISLCSAAAVVIALAFLSKANTEAQSSCTAGNKLLDPGFETTTDDNGSLLNDFWQSTSTVFGTSLCNVMICGDAGGTAGARDGSDWIWFGGTNGPETGTARQTVGIPAGATVSLNYHLWIGAVEAPFTDLFQVLVDGTVVESIVEPATAQVAYQLHTVNLNAYADGQNHTISFQYDSPSGGGVANFSLDDVTLDILCPGTSAPPAVQLANISTRLKVGTADDALIGGFIITGTHSKKIIVRAIGTSLGALGVPGVLGDPMVELHDNTGAVIASNDNWQTTQLGGVIVASQVAEIQNSGLAPGSPAEAAIIAELPPGAYTAVVRGKNDTIGVGLVEAYDLDRTVDSKLANISTRGVVQTGDNVMIGGVIVAGNRAATVVVRAIGPSLAQAGVPNSLNASMLELHDSNGGTLASGDNWSNGDYATAIQAAGLAPTNGNESAILKTLPPGQYTAVVRGQNNSSGTAVVEIYDITSLIFGNVTELSSSQGGTITLPSVGSITFPSGALPSGQAVNVVALNSNSSTEDFNTVAPIFSGSAKLLYDFRISTGPTPPSAPIQISFLLPTSYLSALPPGAALQAFAQTVEDGGEELLDHFDVCPSTFDSAAHTVIATVPPQAFTASRGSNGAFEAIVTVAAISNPVAAANVSRSFSSGLLAPFPDSPSACELNPIGSPLAQLTITEHFNPPGRVHKGIDARVGVSEEVHAVADGTILVNTVQTCKIPSGCSICIQTNSGRQCKSAAYNGEWGWGQYMIVKHTDNTLSIYAHLEKGSTAGSALRPGAPVSKGFTIGKADNSGSSFGSHLHFEYLRAPGNGQSINGTARVNPEGCINATPAPLSGSWHGNWSWSGPGAGGCQFNDGGSFDLNLTQSGNSFSGSVTAAGVEARESGTCNFISIETAPGTMTGNVSGPTVNFSFVLQGSFNSLTFSGSGTLNGNTFSGTFTRDTGGSGSFSVTRQ